MTTRWKIFQCPTDTRDQLSAHLGISPLISQLLIKRGVLTPEDGKKFLSPSLLHLHDPFLMKDMEKAVRRIVEAIVEDQFIVVYGDYDVDGVTSCALLVDFLRMCGGRCSYILPHRIEDGYGLNHDAMASVAHQGAELLVAVDCGVTNHDEVAFARSLGVDVLIVDHHETPETLPDANAVIDPMRPDCPYPFKGMAGVGVVFNLLVALRKSLREIGFWGASRTEPNLVRYLDLVALGTIADVVPLLDMNRLFVTYGLKELERSERLGIITLKHISGPPRGELSTGYVSFRLAPRLNAAGRVASAEKAVDLLLATSYDDASKIARALDDANRERQNIEEVTFRDAREQFLGQGGLERRSIVLSSDAWHPGVIGIVASRLSEEFSRPAVLIALDGNQGKGSARSVIGFDLYNGLKACADHLLGFGGHKYAAGITIHRDHLEIFARAFEAQVVMAVGEDKFTPTLMIDAEIDLEDISPQFLIDLAALGPHGAANPRPLFVARTPLHLLNARPVGKDSLKFVVSAGSIHFDAIAFGMGHVSETLPPRTRIAFYPQISTWNGTTRIQLEVKAFEMATGA